MNPLPWSANSSHLYTTGNQLRPYPSVLEVCSGDPETSRPAQHRSRPGLLAEVAGLALGSAERRGPEYEARGQAVAELCRMAGAGEALIPQWTDEGRRRAEAAELPPFSRPGRAPRRP